MTSNTQSHYPTKTTRQGTNEPPRHHATTSARLNKTKHNETKPAYQRAKKSQRARPIASSYHYITFPVCHRVTIPSRYWDNMQRRSCASTLRSHHSCPHLSFWSSQPPPSALNCSATALYNRLTTPWHGHTVQPLEHATIFLFCPSHLFLTFFARRSRNPFPPLRSCATLPFIPPRRRVTEPSRQHITGLPGH